MKIKEDPRLLERLIKEMTPDNPPLKPGGDELISEPKETNK